MHLEHRLPNPVSLDLLMYVITKLNLGGRVWRTCWQFIARAIGSCTIEISTRYVKSTRKKKEIKRTINLQDSRKELVKVQLIVVSRICQTHRFTSVPSTALYGESLRAARIKSRIIKPHGTKRQRDSEELIDLHCRDQ